MTEYLDILLPALAITAFVGNAIHVVYFMDHNPESSRTAIDDGAGNIIDTQPPEPLKVSWTDKTPNQVRPRLEAHIPHDSVLRRHYVTHLCSLLNELYPRPSESVLRRHHRQLVASQLELCLLEPAAGEKLQAAHEILKKRISEELSNPVRKSIASYSAPDILDGKASASESETVAEVASVSTLKVRVAESESEIPLMGPHVPEDHMLRRHYLTHILGMIHDLYPAPSDSVLSRHHQQHLKNILASCLEHWVAAEQLNLDWLAAKKDPEEMAYCLESENVLPVDGFQENTALYGVSDNEVGFGPHVPEDHVLRRHYLALLESRLNEISPPPTDSVLRRHHQQWLEARLARCIEDAASASALDADYGQWVSERGKNPCEIDMLAARGNAAGLAAKPLHQELPIAGMGLKLPEDSVLRRHYIQYLGAEIEKFMPRPTDSVLSRHYDQWLASEMETLL